MSQTDLMQDTVCRVAIDLSNREFNELQDELRIMNELIIVTNRLDDYYANYADSISIPEKERREYKLKREEYNADLREFVIKAEKIIRKLRMLELDSLCPNQLEIIRMSSAFLASGANEIIQEYTTEISSHQNKTVLVALTAEWCTPCQEYLPALRQFVAQHSDSLALIEIDYEQRSIITYTVGCNYLPTVIVYKNSESIARLEGTAGIAYFEAWLRPYFH